MGRIAERMSGGAKCAVGLFSFSAIDGTFASSDFNEMFIAFFSFFFCWDTRITFAISWIY